MNDNGKQMMLMIEEEETSIDISINEFLQEYRATILPKLEALEAKLDGEIRRRCNDGVGVGKYCKKYAVNKFCNRFDTLLWGLRSFGEVAGKDVVLDTEIFRNACEQMARHAALAVDGTDHTQDCAFTRKIHDLIKEIRMFRAHDNSYLMTSKIWLVMHLMRTAASRGISIPYCLVEQIDELNTLINFRNSQHGIILQVRPYRKDVNINVDVAITHLAVCDSCGHRIIVSGGLEDMIFAPKTCPRCNTCAMKVARHVDIVDFLTIAESQERKKNSSNNSSNYKNRNENETVGEKNPFVKFWKSLSKKCAHLREDFDRNR